MGFPGGRRRWSGSRMVVEAGGPTGTGPFHLGTVPPQGVEYSDTSRADVLGPPDKEGALRRPGVTAVLATTHPPTRRPVPST